MPVPSARTDLSATAGDNSPAGTEAVLPNLDNYLRAAFSFIKQNYDDIQTANTNLTTRLPAGIIAMWSGTVATIPSGWQLCNGTNGTPDLRNRFIVCHGGTYPALSSGGAATDESTTAGAHTHTGSTGSTVLTEANLPAHSHLNGVSGLNDSPFVYGGSTTGMPGSATGVFDIDVGTGTTQGNTSSVGSGTGHTHTISSDGGHTHTVDIVPPYYALAYIMKL